MHAFARRGFRAPCVPVVLSSVLVCPAGVSAEEGPHPLVGTWLAKWGKGVHEEIRVDRISGDGVVDGVFCGVRGNDGSVFFFDFAVAAASFDGSVLSLQRTKHSYAFSSVADGAGVRYVYRRKGRRSHTIVMEPPAEGSQSQCADRVRPPDAGDFDPDAALDGDAPFTGLWNIEDTDGLATELRAVLSPGGTLSGALCYERRDGSMVFFEFAPGAEIEAVASEDGFKIERVPFKAKMTHRLDPVDGPGVRYRERVRRKPWRMDVVLEPGASETGCLRGLVFAR